MVQAAATLETARRLDSLPETAAAARRGDLSVEQTAAIAGAAGADPAVERALLEAAACSPLAELREQCARAKTSHVDLEARRARIHQRRSLRSYTDDEGEWHLHCRNNPEVGARIMAALDPFQEEIFRRARSEGRREPPDAYAAEALAEMARCSGTGSGQDPEADDAQADPTAAKAAGATRAVADGDADLAAEAGAKAVADNGATPATPGPTRARRRRRVKSSGAPKIIVRVDLPALLRGFPMDGETCEIAGFGPIAVSAVTD